MAQEGLSELSREWVALSDIIKVDDDSTYYIQNRGSDMLLACEGGEEPTESTGVLVKPFEVLKYKKNGGSLYLKAYTATCTINITSDKEQTGGAIWFDFNSEGFTCVDDAEAETMTFTKEIDGYDVELVWSYNSEATGFTATVTKDGESAGTASVWFVSENGEIKLNVADLNLELLSESAFEYYSEEATDEGYHGTFSTEVDDELGTSVWNCVESYYNQEDSETLYLKINLEA